jgi:hypothetical protein
MALSNTLVFAAEPEPSSISAAGQLAASQIAVDSFSRMARSQRVG